MTNISVKFWFASKCNKWKLLYYVFSTFNYFSLFIFFFYLAVVNFRELTLLLVDRKSLAFYFSITMLDLNTYAKGCCIYLLLLILYICVISPLELLCDKGSAFKESLYSKAYFFFFRGVNENFLKVLRIMVKALTKYLLKSLAILNISWVLFLVSFWTEDIKIIFMFALWLYLLFFSIINFLCKLDLLIFEELKIIVCCSTHKVQLAGRLVAFVGVAGGVVSGMPQSREAFDRNVAQYIDLRGQMIRNKTITDASIRAGGPSAAN